MHQVRELKVGDELGLGLRGRALHLTKSTSAGRSPYLGFQRVNSIFVVITVVVSSPEPAELPHEGLKR